MTDTDIRDLWRSNGGKFHGPHIETGTMPEAQLLLFIRGILEQRDDLRAKLDKSQASAEFNFEQYQDAGRLLHEKCEKTRLLEKQRDKLLAACEKVRKCKAIHNMFPGQSRKSYGAILDDAIASVKVGK